MAVLRRLVLDVLKPHQPPIYQLAEELGDIEGVESVLISVMEMDQNTQTIKVVVEGSGFSYEDIQEVIRKFGGVVHSVDEVVAGRKRFRS